MKLDINVTLSGQENADNSWTVHAVYSVRNCNPPSQGVVTASGAIDLTKMAKTADYSSATDMTFTIISTVHDKNGYGANVCFPDPHSSAVEFTRDQVPGPPSAPPESEFTVNTSIGTPYFLLFTDLDNSVGSYEYCLKISCCNIQTGSTPVLVRLDPPITNRPADN